MKHSLLALLAALAATPVHSQVIVTFSNFGTIVTQSGSTTWSAPVMDEFGTPLSGPLFKAELIYDAAPFGGTGFEAVPGVTAFLNTGTGRFFGNELTFEPNANPGDEVTVAVRAWHDPDGLTTYDTATRRGQSAPFTIEALDVSSVPPPLPIQLAGMTSFAIVPEPAVTTVVFAITGFVLAWQLRRLQGRN